MSSRGHKILQLSLQNNEVKVVFLYNRPSQKQSKVEDRVNLTLPENENLDLASKEETSPTLTENKTKEFEEFSEGLSGRALMDETCSNEERPNEFLNISGECNISAIENLNPLSPPATDYSLQHLLNDDRLKINETITLSLPVYTPPECGKLIGYGDDMLITYAQNDTENPNTEPRNDCFSIFEDMNVDVCAIGDKQPDGPEYIDTQEEEEQAAKNVVAVAQNKTEENINKCNNEIGPAIYYLDDADDELLDDPDYLPSNTSETSSINEEEQAVPNFEAETPNNVEQGRPKKGRKRKYGGLTRKERSAKKYHYDEFVNFTNKKVEAKAFVDFDCKCRNKCQEKVSVSDRNKEFEKFRSLQDYNAQNLFINANVKEVPKKRSYTTIKEGIKSRPKQVSRIYTLHQITVCKELFLKTLCISSKRVNTALSKMKSDSLLDQRGKQAGWNKISAKMLEEVKQCIDSFPKYVSHYCRSQTKSFFLPPGMTISKMYEVYVNGKPAEQVVSMATFKKIFYTNFNLKFKALKKDTCNKCDVYIAKQVGLDDVELKNAIQEEHNQHLSLCEDATNRMKADMKEASTSEKVECLTFDLEKTLPLPRIPTNIVYYKRQLWVYNCGIHSGTTDKGYCYTWVEGEAGRGAQEVGSCLLKHIKNELPEGTEHLILWSDSCGGQNRNIKIELMLKAVLHDHPTLKKITHKYPIPGHSFLPNDDDFGKIENELRRQQHLYTPEDYFFIMEKCKKKKPLTVVRMTTADFKSTGEIEKSITNRKKTVEGQDVSWLQSRQIENKKEDPLLIYMCHTFDGPEHKVDIKKRPGRNSDRNRDITYVSMDQLVPLWPNGKPISEAKLKDLKSLFNLIPKCYQNFYKSLMADSTIVDDIDGFDGELDFQVEDA